MGTKAKVTKLHEGIIVVQCVNLALGEEICDYCKVNSDRLKRCNGVDRYVEDGYCKNQFTPTCGAKHFCPDCRTYMRTAVDVPEHYFSRRSITPAPPKVEQHAQGTTGNRSSVHDLRRIKAM